MSMAIKYGLMKRAQKSDGMPCDEHGDVGCPMCHGGKMAEGGFVGEEEATGYEEMPPASPKMDEEATEEDDDMIDRIMKQRYSKGGMVANDTPIKADFEKNDFDDLALRDDLESSYTGENSGDEIDDEQEDMDRRDIVSRIMRSRAKKDRLPRPA